MKEDFENVKSVRLHYRYVRGSRYTVVFAPRIRLVGLFLDTYALLRSMWHKPTSKSNIPQQDADYQPIDTAANNVDSVCKAGNKLNSLTTRTPSSVYSMRARVSVASSAMTDLGFFDSMIMFWV